VNEQNEQAVGFYKKMGFTVTGRTEVDDLGRAHPLLNLVHG
ncbi:acetyltransferase, partial [Citrobacter freundii]